MKTDAPIRPRGVLPALVLLLVVAVAASSQTEEINAELLTLVAAPFERAYGDNPFDETQLEQIARRESRVRALPGFAETVAAGQRAVAEPSDRELAREFGSRLSGLVQASGPENILATLFFVFKESIAEENETKRYWLNKLEEANRLGEAMAEYLEEIQEAAVEVRSARKKESGYVEMLSDVLAADSRLRQAVMATGGERTASAATVPLRIVGPSPQVIAKLVPANLGLLIEGEALAATAVASAGPIQVQQMQGFGGQWSGDAQLFWRPPAPVDEPIRNWPNLRLRFEAKAGQTYELTLVHTVAPDYGKFRVFLDGGIVGDVDSFAPQVDVRQRSLGQRALATGFHEMILTVFARNPASQGWNVGVDALRLTSAGQTPPG